jgi:hypothetical protein
MLLLEVMDKMPSAGRLVRESGWLYALAVALSGILAVAPPIFGLWARKSTEDRGAGAA